LLFAGILNRYKGNEPKQGYRNEAIAMTVNAGQRVNETLDESEAVSVWIHFEERASEIKGQMYATLTFLDTVIVTLLGFVSSWLLWLVSSSLSEVPFGPVRDLPNRFSIGMAIFAGYILCYCSSILAEDYIHHIDRNFERAKRLRKNYGKLDQTLKKIGFGFQDSTSCEAKPRELSRAESLFSWFPAASAIMFVIGAVLLVIDLLR
jgi:hypothetical protein